ncbi:hypothetical protein B0O99DRAFT_683711 [Bisporella sp. PMI_857]|nr:hypothetical protein B0O99DRAFT_683711 [Bisporella sp. PMI_857]
MPPLDSTMNKLSIDPKSSSKAASGAVPDSWEDDNDVPETPIAQQSSFPSAPPPTPISPSYNSSQTGFDAPFGYRPESRERERGGGSRPDKTDAVAKRLIAGALGVKAPKRTEEQRAYDRALKEKEIKRREAERERERREEEERERAKRGVWED